MVNIIEQMENRVKWSCLLGKVSARELQAPGRIKDDLQQYAWHAAAGNQVFESELVMLLLAVGSRMLFFSNPNGVAFQFCSLRREIADEVLIYLIDWLTILK